MRTPRSRKSHVARMALTVAFLLVSLLVAACSARVSFGGTQTPGASAATSTPDLASAQDEVPTPTYAPEPTVTPEPTHAPTRTLTRTPTPRPAGIPAAPVDTGQVILVSLSRQQLYAYRNGALAFTFTVETGRPELPTPTGVFHVFLKECSDKRWTSNAAPTTSHNVNCVEHNGDGYQEVFNSPWPEGSPYWYAPTHINYAMEFLEGGYYLHDAWWHSWFGPGSNTPHQLPDGHWETGSHGCVGMRIADAERLYAWVTLGTPVYIRATV
jgi:lipoprotein-anchoring transpeptidase ErfK/SrfK